MVLIQKQLRAKHEFHAANDAELVIFHLPWPKKLSETTRDGHLASAAAAAEDDAEGLPKAVQSMGAR